MVSWKNWLYLQIYRSIRSTIYFGTTTKCTLPVSKAIFMPVTMAACPLISIAQLPLKDVFSISMAMPWPTPMHIVAMA